VVSDGPPATVPGGPPPAFDPYAILGALEEAQVWCVLIGGLARVVQGSDETTAGLDITPASQSRNLERVVAALERLDASPASGARLERAIADPERETPLRLVSPAGEIQVVHRPAGTRGYEDLRRKASYLHIGKGLRPQVAGPGDLVRMMEALDRPEQVRSLEAMRRVVDLDRSRGRGR
jgi:hypothetical protein